MLESKSKKIVLLMLVFFGVGTLFVYSKITAQEPQYELKVSKVSNGFSSHYVVNDTSGQKKQQINQKDILNLVLQPKGITQKPIEQQMFGYLIAETKLTRENKESFKIELEVSYLEKLDSVNRSHVGIAYYLTPESKETFLKTDFTQLAADLSDKLIEAMLGSGFVPGNYDSIKRKHLTNTFEEILRGLPLKKLNSRAELMSDKFEDYYAEGAQAT